MESSNETWSWLSSPRCCSTEATAAGAVTGLVLWAFGAAVMGAGWLGADSAVAIVLAAPLMLATALGLGARWALRISTLSVRMALTIVGTIMLAPHAMFYDVGTMGLAGLVAFDRLGRRALIPVATVWVLSWSQALAAPLGFAPLFFIVVPAGVWLCVELLRDAEALPGGVKFHGTSSKASQCIGRTTVKCRWSTVAIVETFRRSARAMTEASTVPSGKSRYRCTSSAIRIQSPAGTGSIVKSPLARSPRKRTSASVPNRVPIR